METAWRERDLKYGSLDDLHTDHIEGKPPPYASKKSYKRVLSSHRDNYMFQRTPVFLAENSRLLSSSVGDLSGGVGGSSEWKPSNVPHHRNDANDGSIYLRFNHGGGTAVTSPLEQQMQHRRHCSMYETPTLIEEPDDNNSVLLTRHSSYELTSRTTQEHGGKQPNEQKTKFGRQNSWELKFNAGVERLNSGDTNNNKLLPTSLSSPSSSVQRHYSSLIHLDRSDDSEDDKSNHQDRRRSTPRQYSSTESLINVDGKWQNTGKQEREKAKLQQSSSLESTNTSDDERGRASNRKQTGVTSRSNDNERRHNGGPPVQVRQEQTLSQSTRESIYNPSKGVTTGKRNEINENKGPPVQVRQEQTSNDRPKNIRERIYDSSEGVTTGKREERKQYEGTPVQPRQEQSSSIQSLRERIKLYKSREDLTIGKREERKQNEGAPTQPRQEQTSSGRPRTRDRINNNSSEEGVPLGKREEEKEISRYLDNIGRVRGTNESKSVVEGEGGRGKEDTRRYYLTQAIEVHCTDLTREVPQILSATQPPQLSVTQPPQPSATQPTAEECLDSSSRVCRRSLSSSSSSSTSSTSSFSSFIPTQKKDSGGKPGDFGLHTARPIFLDVSPPTSSSLVSDSTDAALQRREKKSGTGSVAWVRAEVREETRVEMRKVARAEVRELALAEVKEEARTEARQERLEKDTTISTLRREAQQLKQMKKEIQEHVIQSQSTLKEQVRQLNCDLEEEQKKRGEERESRERVILDQQKELEELRNKLKHLQSSVFTTPGETKLQRQVSDLQERLQEEQRRRVDDLSLKRRKIISLESQLEERERELSEARREVAPKDVRKTMTGMMSSPTEGASRWEAMETTRGRVSSVDSGETLRGRETPLLATTNSSVRRVNLRENFVRSSRLSKSSVDLTTPSLTREMPPSQHTSSTTTPSYDHQRRPQFARPVSLSIDHSSFSHEPHKLSANVTSHSREYLSPGFTEPRRTSAGDVFTSVSRAVVSGESPANFTRRSPITKDSVDTFAPRREEILMPQEPPPRRRSSGVILHQDSWRSSLGLPNLGNTCYINSVMQCLFNLDPLRLYFMHHYHKSGRVGALVGAVAGVFGVMESGKGVVQAMQNLKDVVEGHDKVFRLHPHPPAHHLLSSLLSWLHADLGIELGDAPLRLTSSVVSSLFHGLRESVIVCPERRQVVSSAPECFDLLTLTLPPGPPDQFLLQELLGKKLQPQEVLWGCGHCRRRHPCTHITRLLHPPDVLVLVLGRPRSNSTEVSGQARVEYPATGLTLHGHLVEGARSSPVYDLVSVVSHRGTISSGHYIAYCRSGSGRWWLWDDTELQVARLDQVLSQTDAHILFYQAAHQ